MNRRQKMKRMKQELEWYKKQMVPTHEVGYDSRQMKVETLCASQYYSKSHVDYLYSMNPEGLVERIREDFIDSLASGLEDYIQFSGIDHTDMPDTYEIIGKLKVVVPHGGDRI